ncbi:MAG: FUSC family protein, partial [Mycolicibacterium sp.]
NDEVATLSNQALATARINDEAVRQYLSESSGETDFRAPIVRSFNRVLRLRVAADLIADIPTPPPLSAYPKVRAVLEFHTEAICERLAGRFDPEREWQPMSDDFVLALRAEARDDDLGVSAALPLLTVAALLGELELIYPMQPTP